MLSGHLALVTGGATGIGAATVERLARLVEQTLRGFGQIDILVNCAGITRPTPSEDYPEEDWDMTLAVNLSAIFHLCKLVANKAMIPQRSGVIINLGSINSVVGFPNNPAYQTAKGGLLQLTRAFATDWAKYNIRVNNICPGYFNTPFSAKSYNDPQARAARASRNMLNRWGQPEEMVGPVIFLASDASSYITGNDLFVDGGWATSGLTQHQM
jgi:NAD(P)-dependent dehydrogenase (short-subunit alcohol dehydrogenase family)